MRDRSVDVRMLIAAARKGQRDLVGPLLESYRDYLRRFARDAVDAAVKADLDTSDIVQETLIKRLETARG